MKRPRAEKIIAWSLAFVFVASVWQLGIPTGLKALLVSWGIIEGTFLYYVLVDGGVAILFVGIFWVTIHFCEDILWRWWPWFGCKRGWWIYALVAEQEKGISRSVKVVGLFYVLHTTSEVCIKEGHAFYLEDGQIIPRGNWSSDLTWVGADRIQFVFTMHNVHPNPEAVPSNYDGYLALSSVAYPTLVGIGSWKGHFYDLGDRRDIAGGVYAERLSPLQMLQENKVERIMGNYAEELIKRVY